MSERPAVPSVWRMLWNDPGIPELLVVGMLVILGRRDLADRRILARREARNQ